MRKIEIIQGGMGVAISDWKLAKSVSKEGQLGVISGTGIHLIMIARLMEGDIGGHVRRALSNFPFHDPVQWILKKYYRENPEKNATYKRPPMWSFKPSKALNELVVVANFVETFLAKEGHDNPVGINLLEKVQMPTMASLYGAMLAGVDYVIMGAGIPLQIPGILDKLANHEKVNYRMDVKGADSGDSFLMDFDPKAVFSNVAEKVQNLLRPNFLPIISSVVLAKTLIRRSTGKVNGFVVEGHIAGGHNAPPRGKMQLDKNGEPIYGEKDTPKLDKIKELGLPFWLAGGFASPKRLKEAQDAGAEGIQAGTIFAFSNESGMTDKEKRDVIQKVVDEAAEVFTDPRVSPTGYPFKVVQMENTMSTPAIYEARPRLCDIGLLREAYKRDDGKVGYRCAAEPKDQYIKKSGKAEDAEGRGCLCNNLCASAGFPQHRKDGYVEQPLVTSGNWLPYLGRVFKEGEREYSAKDVLDYLLS
ncbi:MAG: nitronate monooxygenase [Anaerolineae bacterium]|jgi:nitronate monooxygenase|nr:nitronate monooxygenase [Anaerolineae bacterium]